MQILWLNIIQAVRSLRTQAWQVAISSVSLAVGIVCLAFSTNWFWAETHYDSFRPNYEQMYVLELALTDSTEQRHLPYITWLECQNLKQQTEDGTFSVGLLKNWTDEVELNIEGSNEKHLLKLQEMDTAAVKILITDMIHGDAVTAIKNGGNDIIITDKAAMRIFGTADVVGKSLALDGWPWPIKGVCKAIEGASNFEYDIIRQFYPSSYDKTNYNNWNYKAIVQTANPAHTQERMSHYRRKDLDESSNLGIGRLIPLRFFPKLSPEAMQMQQQKYSFIEGYFYNIVFCIISMLLVISAMTNLIMVFTSINLSRVREYALRRSMGATAWQNVEWMLIGILPTLLISLLLSGGIMEWLVELADIPWDTRYIYSFLYMAEAAVVVLCLLGMGYPIYKMRRAYRISFLGLGNYGRSHQWLIVVQCVACAFLLFLSLGMQRQVSGMVHADLGFDTKNMLRLHTSWVKPEGFTKYFSFRNIHKDLVQEFGREAGAGIVDVLPMETDIFNRLTRNTIVVTDQDTHHKWKSIDISLNDLPYLEMDYVEIPFRATEFFNIRLKNGNRLTPDDEHPDKLQVYLNPEAMKLVAPDGTQRLEYRTISFSNNAQYSYDPDKGPAHWNDKILNIKDVTELRATDFYTPASATMYVGVEEYHPCMKYHHDAIYIKYADGRREDAEAAVRKVLAKFDVPEGEYLLTTFEEYISDTYKKETFIANLLSALTVFSVVITLAGVFSMLLYSLRLRRRSMAIHRVMGATFKDIFRPMLRPYLLFALIGAVVAYFPAKILMTKWMEYFHYGEAPGVWLMLTILAAMCGIITLFVWWQVGICMKERPVEVLKPEA